VKQPLADIEVRREHLVQLAAQQREQLAYFYRQCRRPIVNAQNTLDRFSWLKSPWGMALIGLVVWKTPLRKLVKAPLWLWRGWKFTRMLNAPTRRTRRRPGLLGLFG
jgi:hypothetical protein